MTLSDKPAVVISVRLLQEQMALVRARAERDGQSVSEVVRRAVAAYVVEYASGPLEPVMVDGRQVGWQRRALPISDET